MLVDWTKLLVSLGCNLPDTTTEVKCLCPFHLQEPVEMDTETLHDVPWYYCPRCGFSGDVFDLVAQFRKQPVATVVFDFTRDGALANVLDKPIAGWEAEKRLTAAQQVTRLQLWSTQTRTELEQRTDVAVRVGLPVQIDQWPDDIGYSQPGAASEGTVFGLVMPFTNGERITFAAVKPLTETKRWTHTVGDVTGGGVYLEKNARGSDVVVNFYHPLVTAIVTAKLQGISSKRPPVVCIADFPMPLALRRSSHLILAETEDSTYPLDFLCRAYQALHKSKIKVWVRTLTTTTAATPLEEWARLKLGATKGTSLETVLLERVTAVLDTVNDTTGQLSLLTANLDVAARTALCEAAQKLRYSKVVELLSTAQRYGAVMELATHALVQATPDGFVGWLDGKRMEVSNFTLRIDYCESDSRTTDYIGQATAQGITFPIRLTADDVRTATSLVFALNKQFPCSEQRPYFAAYQKRDIAWSDILNRLASQVPTRPRVCELGADPDGYIRFPALKLDCDTASWNCDTTPVAPETAALYPSSDWCVGTLAPYKALFGDVAGFHTGGLALAFSFIALQQAQAIRAKSKNRIHTSEQMVFVTDEPNVWDAQLRELAEIVHGRDHVLPLNAIPAAIGSLPAITEPLTIDELRQTPHFVITSGQRSEFVGEHLRRCCYVTPPETITSCYCLTEADVMALRHGFISFLAIAVPALLRYSTRHSTALDAYRILCTVMQIPARAEVTRLYGCVCPPPSASVGAFFHALYQAIRTRGELTGVVEVKLGYGNRAWYNANIAIGPTAVMIRKRVPELINKERRYGVFDAAALEDALKAEGLLMEQDAFFTKADRDRCWLITKKVWDSYVTTPFIDAKPLVELPLTACVS